MSNSKFDERIICTFKMFRQIYTKKYLTYKPMLFLTQPGPSNNFQIYPKDSNNNISKMEIMGESQQNSEQKMERKQKGKGSSLRLMGPE